MAPKSKTPANATLKDVAERVGVSVSAVSMALLDHPRIGAETKRRVRQAADDLGYVTNSAARALRANKADAIALIVPNTSQHVFGHSYFTHVLTGMTTVANTHDAQLVISTNPDDVHDRVAYDRVIRSGSVDGAIVTSAAVTDDGLKRLVASEMPMVLLGRFPYLPDAVSVGIDDIGSSFTATDHLIREHARHNVVHLSGPLEHQSAIDRRDGYLVAIQQHGLTPHIIEGDYGEESGTAAGAAIAELDPVDGIVAANDEMAFGAIRHLISTGRTVPEDIAVIGFDDFGLSRVTTPSISTMHVPAERMAAQATGLLFDLIGGAQVAATDTHVVLPVELVARQSCGCARTPW